MKKRILCLFLAILMVVSVLPAPTNAVDVGTADSSGSVVGKFAKVTTFSWGEARKDPNYAGNMVTSDHYPELLVITGVAVVGSTTYYQLSAAEGYTWPAISNAADGWYLESTKVVVLEACSICGMPGCAVIHFYCDRCLKYDCGKDHLYCPACGKPDCTESHTWCGLCGDYDCGIAHGDMTPNSTPIIPDNPTMTEGAEVSIVDEYGDPVTEEGFLLLEGVKSSLSAWSDLDENVFYQWQIRYDVKNDLWTDIQGQRGKGILLSPAMVLSIIEDQGSAAVRCTVTAGDKTLTSAAIPVEVLAPLTMAAFSLESGSGDGDVSEAAEDDENKVNLIINYVFTDGKIAANPWAATLPKGVAYSTTTPITVPVIAGYAPSLGDGVDTTKVTLSADGKLSLNFTAEDLAADQTINIVYQPAPVKVVVNHHWQNVADDNYTLHETVETTAVTGTKLGDVHKSYEGFYNLLYEHPTVAADGSTVVDVYNDRYYYLMTFDLSGGYGMDAIYARYGATIPLETMSEPTRPGYILTGWTLDGRPAAVMSTMPARNTTFVAVWTPGEPVNYTIVYWKENADDNNYSYWTQVTLQAIPGTKISGTNSIGSVSGINDEQYFTYNDHLTDKDVEVKGDGSTVINVYYNRNYYTIYFKGYGKCAMEAHTHGTNCNTELICGANGHTHTADCQRTLNCDIQEHVHTDNCLKCGLPIHTEHTESCLTCQITEHTHSNACCTVPVHTHSPSNCCSIPDHSHGEACCILEEHEHTYDSRSGNKYYGGCYPEDGARQPNCGKQAHTHSSGWNSSCTCEQEEHSHSYYYGYNSSCNTEKCGLAEHNHSSGCVYCSENLTEHTHSESNNCYSDVIHTTHTETCYDHTAHSHTEPCYIYKCGLEPHVHDDSCYRACTKPVHTHTNNCNLNRDSNVIYVITAKYEQNIDNVWPTYDRLKAGNYAYEDSDGNVENANGNRFRGWDVDDVSNEAVSKRVTMTSDLCDTNDGEKDAIAQYSGSYFYKLYYMFESFDQTSPASGNDRHYYDSDTNGVSAKYYDSSATFYQELYYNSNTTFNQKQITGMTAVGREKTTTGSENNNNLVIYNFLYYTRNRWDLKFHNVNEVIKTEADIMFEQPLANYKDSDGNLLSAFVPPYPTDSYEADTMEFEGWYITPECFEGTKVNFANLTMPNNDLTLYAHWIPVSRTVRFFLDEADMEAGVVIPDRMDALWKETHDNQSNPNSPYVKFNTKTDVPNKSFLSEIDTPGVSDGYDNHPYKGFTFVGWFYMDDGVEKAFDPKNMPVTQDMDLYGKWSSNVLCPYEIRFVLDENGNGVLDAGETTFVADPITGSTLAGNSRTFNAKGDTALYAGYQSGYYPNVASHTIDFKASDESGVVYTFLYKPGDPVPYTVKYLEKGTNKVLATEVTYPNNQKAVVTENFKPIPGYMPDAFQKTLVVVPGSAENVIIFYYTVDTVHAPYQVNHYVQTLDGTGWMLYRSADFTGDIDKAYSADALTITGFTFSTEKTKDFNIDQEINGYDGSKLPGAVSFDGMGTVSGTLTGNGMQLNLYYTRNTHSYKVQYLEYGTNEVLEEEKVVTNVYHGTLVTENAITIQRDMDGDGQFDDFQLYEATAPSQSATITDDSKVFVFYYVRCTGEELSVTKALTGNPGEDISFDFNLTSTATDFAEISNGVYAYEIKEGETSVEKGYKSVTNGKTITFSLQAGQTITFFGMPTAVYTVTEHELPLGYYETSSKNQKVTLTKDARVNITVANEYAPAALEVMKKVNRIENVTDNVTDFAFYITVPTGVTGTYSYTVGTASRNVTVADGKMTITLRDGETALFANLPAGVYTVAEKNYTSEGYSAVYVDTDDTTSDGKVTLIKGQKDSVLCTNAYPVGSLTITKTVKKDYANDAWTGGTFKFTVVRTDGTLNSTSYPVYSGTTKIGDAIVGADGKLVVEIAFTELGTKTIKIDNLPQGKYTVEEAEHVDYTQDKRSIETSISPTDYAGKAEFTNTYKKHLGDLTITKNVTALTGYTAPEDAEFAFIVSGTALRKSSYQVVIDGASADCEVVNGALRLRLKGGQTAVIKDLALDHYTVTEQVDDRFVMTAYSGTDGTINAEDTAKAEFTNTYVPRGNLKLTKYIDRDVYENIQVDTDQEFAFTITFDYPLSQVERYTAKTYAVGEAEPIATTVLTGKTLTFTLKHNQYIIVEGLPAVGYTVTEAEIDGYQSPVFVDNASGTIPADGSTQEVICYNPVELVPGDLKITKIIKDTTNNNSAPKNLPFEFTVTLNYITEPKNADGVYRVEYTCDPTKGTLVEVKNGDVVTGYRYTPIGGEEDTLPATVTIEPGMDLEHAFTLKLYDGITATVRDLPPSAYHVSEKDYSQDGFAASWTGNEIGLLGGALINGNNPVEELTCTNTYPINTNGKLLIKKQVTKDYARDVLPADLFTFKVTPTDGNILEGDYTVTISDVNVETVATTTTATAITDANDTYLLVEIPFTAAEMVMELNDGRTKTLTIEGLPLGQYEVEETVDEDYRQTPETLKQSVYVGTNPGDATFINRYKRHLGNIQITKKLAEESEGDGSDFLFHILDGEGHVIMSVTLKAGETKTIWDLPVGTYTVKEDSAWNWRYELKTINGEPVAAGVNSTTADLNVNETVAVTFTNEYRENQWLNFFTSWLNVFQKS